MPQRDEAYGPLNQRGDHTWFGFTDEYLSDSHRAILGLVFEQDPQAACVHPGIVRDNRTVRP